MTMIKLVQNYMLSALSYILVVPFTMLMWYSEYVDGVEPKAGYMLLKGKTVKGQRFVKQRGLKNIFKPWELAPKGNLAVDLSINSLYPSAIIVKDQP